MTNPKYFVQCVEEYSGYSDYWGGHGHAFAEDDILGCITLSAPIDYTETNQQVKDALNEDQSEFYDMTSDGKSLDLDEADKALKAWVNKEIPSNKKPYFTNYFGEPIEHDEDSMVDELPIYLLVLHVFKDDSA